MSNRNNRGFAAGALAAAIALAPSHATWAAEIETVDMVVEEAGISANTYNLPPAEIGTGGSAVTSVVVAVATTDAANLRDDPFAEQARLQRKRFIHREIMFQALNIIDAVQTMSCMEKIDCREMNPLLSERPDANEVLAFKAGTGAAHLLISYLLYETAPEALSGWQLSTVVVQGGAVCWNLQYSF